MRRVPVLILGVLTFLPAIYIVSFAILVVATIVMMDRGPLSGDGFVVLFVLHIATGFLSLALIGYYVYDAWNNSQITSDKKVLWLVVILFFGPFAWPVYWYNFKWKADAIT